MCKYVFLKLKIDFSLDNIMSYMNKISHEKCLPCIPMWAISNASPNNSGKASFVAGLWWYPLPSYTLASPPTIKLLELKDSTCIQGDMFK